MFESEIFLHYNPYHLVESFSDKNYINLNLPGINTPKVCFRNIGGTLLDKNYKLIDVEKAVALCMEQDEIIIKPTLNSCGGDGISFVKIHKNDADCVEKLKACFASYGKDYVVQEVLKQHEYMAKFNKSSLNTIRVMSLLINGEVHILSSIIRYGSGNSRLDNLCAGGSTIGVNNKGNFSKFGLKFNGKVGCGYLQSNEIFEKYPELKNAKFKFYDEVVALVKEAHPCYSHFKLVSWDVAIDSDGHPCIIEVNLDFPEFMSHQLFNGPIFGDLTEDVLTDVYKYNHNNF
jgi:hypothetical protein